MHEPDWLFKGTLFWKRSDNAFTVVPSSSLFLGMLTPRKEVEKYNFDKGVMNELVGLLCDTFGYERELVWNVDARYERQHKEQRETTFLVKSMENRDLTYKVSLRNLPKKNEYIETIMRSLRELKFSCNCGRGIEKDLICSMPYEACRSWGISKKEWEGSLDIPKFYGEVMDKHVIRSLKVHGAYPMFSEDSFHLILPEMVRTLRTLSKENQDFKETDMDVALRPYMNELNFGSVFRYFKILHEKEKIETRLER